VAKPANKVKQEPVGEMAAVKAAMFPAIQPLGTAAKAKRDRAAYMKAYRASKAVK
jgi:hypothetical protein